MKKTAKKKKNAYCLRLSNGQEWSLVATNGLNNWLKAFATILELKPCTDNNKRKIIFTKGRKKFNLRPKIPLSIDHPLKGWERNNIGSIQIWEHETIRDIICEVKQIKNEILQITHMMQSLRAIYQKVIHLGGFPFHCGMLEKDGQAVVISAPGSTGKSTCCRRIPAPWTAHADDAALIVKNKDNKYYVHPFPTWSDYLVRKVKNTWEVEKHFPLKAIFFIEQTKGKEQVIPIWSGQAVILINQQITHANYAARKGSAKKIDKKEQIKQKKLVFNNACELAKHVPCFILRVHIKGKFWEHIEKALANNPQPMQRPNSDNSIKLYTPKIIASIKSSKLRSERRKTRRRQAQKKK